MSSKSFLTYSTEEARIRFTRKLSYNAFVGIMTKHCITRCNLACDFCEERDPKFQLSRMNWLTAKENKLTIALADLRYPPEVLKPHISSQTLEYNHGKNHKAFVTRLNDAIEGTKFANLSLEEVIQRSADIEKHIGIFNALDLHRRELPSAYHWHADELDKTPKRQSGIMGSIGAASEERPTFRACETRQSL